MNKLLKRSASVVILFALVAAFSGALEPQKGVLSPFYKTWLEEEVVYIITPVERSVFLKLQNDREREMFVEAFWKQRDPTPNSPENEFRAEHYRRIGYANQFLGRETPRAGWRTDRGRVYIILGEPNDIIRYDSKAGLNASEVWFYQGKEGAGLPPGFNIVFYKESGHGEFRLYSPARNGPQALLNQYTGSPTDYAKAYEELSEIEPSLASVSLSLIPGDSLPSYGRPSLSSDLLLQRVETTPQSLVREAYARKFLDYKEIVEVEYTANYLDSDALVRVFRDPATGISFVHFAIEPLRLSVNQYEKSYYTTLKLNGSLAAPDGRHVYQFDRTYSIDLAEEQIRVANAQPFNLLDMFPVVPGNYKLSLLLKNEVSKEFTSFEQSLSIPPASAGILLTQPVLAYRATRLDAPAGQMRTFQLGPMRLYAPPNRVFLASDTLFLAFQALGLSGEANAAAEIRISFLRDGKAFREEARKVGDMTGLPDVVLEYNLADFPPAHYVAKVAILVSGDEIVAATEEFDITHAASVPRPWTFSRHSLPAGAAIHELALGTQLFNLERFEEARVRLERAAAGMPNSSEAALTLARLLRAQGEPGAAAEALNAFLSEDAASDYEVFFVAGSALRESGNSARALEVFERAIIRFGVNVALLNSIGECQLALGKRSEALAAWEKSLELSPNQDELRKKIEDLKKKPLLLAWRKSS